jgi:putative transposase
MQNDSSKPRRKPIRLPANAYRKPSTWYFLTLCCKNKAALFAQPGKRNLVRQVLLDTAKTHHVELAVYTILPNHLHVICSAGKNGVPGFVRAFKSRSAVELKRGFGAGSPWQFRYFDHKIRGEESLDAKCRYVRLNPVRLGLVARAEDYPWTGTLRTD